jgi:phosphoribosyl-ATP pyrophosphohydrolase
MNNVLGALQAALEERRAAAPGDSYVASLYGAGLNKILEKVGEEATEVVLAAKDFENTDASRSALIAEVADLWFHTMVMLAHLNLSQEEVLDALGARMGTSGLTEKQSRSKA